jgi:hypothetical protein
MSSIGKQDVLGRWQWQNTDNFPAYPTMPYGNIFAIDRLQSPCLSFAIDLSLKRSLD